MLCSPACPKQSRRSRVRMKSFLHKIIILSCALYLSGAHWIVLQGTAWTGMLVSRAISTSVSEALSSTFDGQHPCAMCSAIAEGKCNEDDADADFAPSKKSGEIKFLTLVLGGPPARSIDQSQAVWPRFEQPVVVRGDAPPTPPPVA